MYVSVCMERWIVASGSMGSFLGHPFFGRMSDRIGAKTVLLISLVIGIGGSLLYAISTTPWMLLGGRAISGFSGGRMSVCQSYVVQVTSTAERTAAMAWMGGLGILGIAAGPGLGTLLSFINVTFCVLLPQISL
jgi:MFS family permease